MITIKLVQYDIPHTPSKLNHIKRSLLDVILTFIVKSIGSSHICQICNRVEQSGKVSGWLQISHPLYKDKSGCSCVCNECVDANIKGFKETYFKKRYYYAYFSI